MSGGASEAWALGQEAANRYDRCILGGRPAGLTAAIFLARLRRRAVVLDDRRSRAALPSPSYERAERGCHDEVALQTLLNICPGGPQ